MSRLMARQRRKHSEDQSGFTLIELLVVIIILGVLSAVVVFAVRGTGDKGQSAAQATDVKTLRTAEEAFCAKIGYYGTMDQLTGTAPADAAGNTYKFLSEKGSLNTIQTEGVSGTCGDGTKGPSGYKILCTVTATNNCQAAVAGGAVATGGTMVLASGSLGGPYNPATTSSGNTHPLSEPMFNGLLAFDSAGAVVPDLAASMPTVTNNGDGSQDMDVTLRSGIKWHDSGVTNAVYNPAGAVQTVSADDVVFSYQYAILKGQGRTAGSMGPALGYNATNFNFGTNQGITATGPLTVRFHFLYPYSLIAFKQMNVTEGAIIPKHVYSRCAEASGGGQAPATSTLNTSNTLCAENFAPVGSGPFTWSGQTTTQINAAGSITLNKNSNYFKTGLPYLSKIVLQNTSTAATSLQAARGTSGSTDTASLASTQVKTPFDFTTSSSYSVASIPRGSGGANCINTISFNLWQPVASTTVGTTTFTLSEYAGEPGISGGLPGTAPPMSRAAIVAQAANAPYNNPILSSFLVRKAMFEGFDRAQAAINDTGLSTAVGAPVGTPRMADSIYNSNLPVAYSPTTFPGGTGANLGKPTVVQANADLDAAGWDGGLATNSRGKTVRTWGNHGAGDPVPLPQQTVLGLVPGTRFNIDITHHYSATQPAISVQFISDMLTLGIDVIDRNIFTGSGSSIASQYPAIADARNFQIGITSYCHGDDPVIGSQRQYVSSSINTAFAANMAGNRDQCTNATCSGSGDASSMDGLWYQVNRATTASARTTLFGQIQAKEVGFLSQIPVDETPSFRVTRNVCGGLNNQNTGLLAEAAYCSS
ncbi:MAG TPA: ABC transporter substrate-binding protein [Acidimicrobiales bacterium]|nr:ABC transporter substrate-binding protein [Acidimicrobiales bacterium]